MGAILFVWVLGVFVIVGIVCWYLAQFVIRDSLAYDEEFVWGRKVRHLIDEEKKH
ncbi:hypothetical protein [Paenibacillus sp. 481]|uniref:hypothetical protein n=1 Tax=Paenibacillus sp. 481 TaxID=2835869 RepID=UPI001E3201D5|nr:hypothetical protein [Paenibacillus sp. 481]UHA74091.1 hypothetical protein KIK04_02780 [Paenibacillus sp. 481]